MLVSVNQDIHHHIIKYATEKNKPIEVLKRRGDIRTIKYAERNMRYVLGFIDYIGGLEFDAVVVNNASDAVYSSHSVLDMKLLYVAITRALHELNIVYTGELTKSLDVYSQLNDNPKILIKSGN